VGKKLELLKVNMNGISRVRVAFWHSSSKVACDNCLLLVVRIVTMMMMRWLINRRSIDPVRVHLQER